MKLLRRIAAPIAALGIAMSAIAAPTAATAAELSPAEVAGDTAL